MSHPQPSPVAGRALVLAGGGLVGIGWEVGVLLGLRASGAWPDSWDRIVGTSAGSVVGATLGTSDGLERLAATDWLNYGQELATYMAGLDPAAVARIDALWFGTPFGPDQAPCAEIGRLARAAVTGSPERFEGAIGPILPDRDWPAALKVTAIDAEDGSLRLFDAGSGIALVKAVAASCSVPGVFPPVEIDGRLYIDGGVRSGSGLDLAAGFRSVVGIAPVREDLHGEDQLVAETAVISAAGTRVVLIRPTAGPEVVLPTDSLDAGRLPDAVKAGRAAGIAQAAVLRAILQP
ncbi:MAG: patatin-like phospholipase family protein [Chloroflexota bacterium]|nr:patatin-like phospholipase family protein [Chloroflexota bacterium]